MRILFVCHGNAYRSPLAEALLKKLRPDLMVDSAGLHVAIPIASEVRDYLRKRGALRFLKDYPESLDKKNLKDYDLIVTMDPKVKSAVLRKCPDCKERVVGWNIKDPYFETQGVEIIFGEIENQVKKIAISFR
jgi:protein-tyrosine-phosphatase